MSFLTSTRLGRPQATVAIIGITGKLGQSIAPLFLKEYKAFFPRVVGTTRDTNSVAANALAIAGAEMHQVTDEDGGESLFKVLRGVEVVIDTLGSPAGKMKDLVIQAVAKAGVFVFFPSEFGCDHRLNEFPGYEHAEWTTKAVRDRAARELMKDKTKIISVYTSCILELIGPFMGYDTNNHKFTIVGSSSQRITFNSFYDIGRSVAELSLLALSRTNASTVPDYVRIAGTTQSILEIKEIVEKARKEAGIKDDHPIKIVSEDLEVHKQRVKERQQNEHGRSVMGHLWILMAEGKMDFTAENDNELINPNQGVWKWKSMEDYVRSVDGKFGESR